MKSLEPLRRAIPCELVMADTGSDDGSREIAEKYADILIDFPWVNDFSAARNAVMDQCSGEWYLTVDCDEWLDENISELVFFLQNAHDRLYAAIIVRNYKTPELERGGRFSDFSAARLLRMSTGARFVGSIHERWNIDDDMNVLILKQTILHHDGYLYQDDSSLRKKTERNMALLRNELKKDPGSLRLLMQCLESADAETEDYADFAYLGVQGVKEKREGWKLFGSSIIRHAVLVATVKKLPELEEWVSLAEEYFPNSLFTRIDVQYLAMGHSWEKENYSDCIRRCKIYFKGLEDFEKGNYDPIETVCSLVNLADPYWKQSTQLFMAAAYLMEKQPQASFETLQGLTPSIMDQKQVKDCARNFCHLHSRSQLDTDAEFLNFWEKLNAPEPSEEKARERRREFLRLAMDVFHPDYRAGEQKESDYCRPAYTLFLPLLRQKDCELGTAAAILQTKERLKLEKLLGSVEKWEEFPIHALAHALEQGVSFPLPDKPLRIEEMDTLAGRLAANQKVMPDLVARAAESLGSTPQSLIWGRALALAGVRSYPWTAENMDEAQGLELARAFSETEWTFLHQYYMPSFLCEENIGLLPAFHRFGWYCAQAFDALENGDTAGYVHLLREGLALCEGMKDMVSFLVEHTEEVQAAMAPPPELVELANQVRAILARYDPNDPAVEALKQSEAYQKVAYLLERR